MRHRFTTIAGVLLGASLLGGCAEAPFIAENNPRIEPPEGVRVVSLCYDGSATTREELSALAQKECDRGEEGTRVEFWHHDRMLNECPVLAKMRVSYLCVPARN